MRVTGKDGGETNLITSTDNYVRSSEEFTYSGGVGVKETLLCLGDAVTTPIDLDKLWEFALCIPQ